MRAPLLTDHNEIRRWAVAHDAHPAEVIPYTHDSEPAILRFVFGSPEDFKDHPEFRLISWEHFFATFELLGLTLRPRGDQMYELLLDPDRVPQDPKAHDGGQPPE
jgi:hypothetical protein